MNLNKFGKNWSNGSSFAWWSKETTNCRICLYFALVVPEEEDEETEADTLDEEDAGMEGLS